MKMRRILVRVPRVPLGAPAVPGRIPTRHRVLRLRLVKRAEGFRVQGRLAAWAPWPARLCVDVCEHWRAY